MNVGPHDDLTTRANGAGALAAYALDVFERSARDLDQAASDQELTALLAQERIDELSEIRDQADAQARDNRNAASSIRKLVGNSEEGK